MKRRDFCKALVCSAALAPGLALPRAEAAAKSQTVGRAVPAGNYTMSFRSELSQMDIEHEYYYSDSFFAHASIQYDHQLALATLGMVTAAFNTWASDAKYWANGDVGRENSLDAAYTKLGFGDVKYRYYDVDVGKAGDFVGWSTARKTITLNGKRTTIVALVLRGGPERGLAQARMAHDEGARAVDLRQRLKVVHHAHGRIGPQADLAGRVRPLAREEGREPVRKVAVVARDVLVAEHRHGVPVVHDLLDGLIAGRRIGRKEDVDGARRGALRLGQHEVHGEGELPRLQLQRELHAPVLRLAGPVVLPVRRPHYRIIQTPVVFHAKGCLHHVTTTSR